MAPAGPLSATSWKSSYFDVLSRYKWRVGRYDGTVMRVNISDPHCPCSIALSSF